MSPNSPAIDLQTAADAVVEYALIALRSEFHHWDKNVNLTVAEMVWNLGFEAFDPSVYGDDEDPLMDALIRTLAKERFARLEQHAFLVLGLDVRSRSGELVFTFSIIGRESGSLQPCEIAVDWPPPPTRN